MDLNNREMLREKMIEHYTKPNFKGLNVEGVLLDAKSDVCQDRVRMSIIFKNDIFKDIRFDGEGCAISMAAADVLCQTLKNKDKIMVLEILNQYTKMLNLEEYDEKHLEDLIIFHQVGKQKSRVQCANISVNKIINFLK